MILDDCMVLFCEIILSISSLMRSQWRGQLIFYYEIYKLIKGDRLKQNRVGNWNIIAKENRWKEKGCFRYVLEIVILNCDSIVVFNSLLSILRSVMVDNNREETYFVLAKYFDYFSLGVIFLNNISISLHKKTLLYHH